MNKVNDYGVEEYKEFPDEVDFGNFSFTSSRYRRDEVEILQPQLEALGYEVLEWLPGETDSFGPLTRVCKVRKDDEIIWFIYG